MTSRTAAGRRSNAYDDARSVTRWSSNGLASLFFAISVLACSAGSDPVTATSVDAAASSGNGGGGASGDGDGDGDGAGPASSGVTIGSGGSGGGEGGGCDSFKEVGERKPLHLWVVIDKSSSMDGDKWDNTVNGVGQFAESSQSEGIDFAMHFLPKAGTPTCAAQEYDEPEVGWGPLPDIAPDVAAALDTANPDGQSTPIYPALGGALLATIARVDMSPGDAAAVLLMTDGAPQGPAETCSGVDPESTEAIAQLAANALDRDNPVFTFVVGLRNVDLDFANAVAAAGGTEEAFPIAGDNPAASLIDALDTIRQKALPCSYEIPEALTDPDSSISINEVNVEITVDGDEKTIPRNDDCDGEGWYYDDPSDPTEILLCPDSCEDLRSDPVGALNVVLGCETLIN